MWLYYLGLVGAFVCGYVICCLMVMASRQTRYEMTNREQEIVKIAAACAKAEGREDERCGVRVVGE